VNIPRWLWIIIISLVIIGVFGVIFNNINTNCQIRELDYLALILTLIAIIVYVYYTYLIAKDAWTPCASFVLQQKEDDKYHLYFLIQNHSEFSLNCWCKLNAKIYEQSVEIGGFYSGKSSFDIQPYGHAQGHFDLRTLIEKSNKTLDELKSSASPTNNRQQLHFNIEFWYNPIGSKKITCNVRQPYFFDFTNDSLSVDF